MARQQLKWALVFLFFAVVALLMLTGIALIVSRNRMPFGMAVRANVERVMASGRRQPTVSLLVATSQLSPEHWRPKAAASGTR